MRVEHHTAQNETVLYGLGDLHLRVMLQRMTERYGVARQDQSAEHPLPRDDHAPGRGHHRHKKQTGGAGQFGEVYLRVEPLERGAGFEFVDDVVGGAIPGQFIPAVEKGVRQVLAGAPSPASGCRTCASASTTASTTRWTPRKWPSSRRARRPSSTPIRKAAADRARADRARGDQHAGRVDRRRDQRPRDATRAASAARLAAGQGARKSRHWCRSPSCRTTCRASRPSRAAKAPTPWT